MGRLRRFGSDRVPLDPRAARGIRAMLVDTNQPVVDPIGNRRMQNSLAQYTPFRGLSDEECGLIERSGEWVRARRGQIVIAEQKSNKAVYIVAEGSVDVRLSDSAGVNIDLASLGPGMLIGEYSFVDGLPAAASAVTATEAVLFRITHEKFNEILEGHDRIGRIVYRNLLVILVARLRAVNAELDLFNA